MHWRTQSGPVSQPFSECACLSSCDSSSSSSGVLAPLPTGRHEAGRQHCTSPAHLTATCSRCQQSRLVRRSSAAMQALTVAARGGWQPCTPVRWQLRQPAGGSWRAAAVVEAHQQSQVRCGRANCAALSIGLLQSAGLSAEQEPLFSTRGGQCCVCAEEPCARVEDGLSSHP